MAQTVDVLGVPHAYELTPPRPAPCVLVFIHGWLLSREYWRPLISQLAQDYQCLSYDLRGFGESCTIPASDKTKEISASYTPEAYAKDLIELIESLNIENVWLVGHSLGGSIALWASDLAPHLINGVICVNSGGGIYVKEEFEKFRMAGRQLVRFRTPWISHFPFFNRLLARMNVAQPIDLKWGRQRLNDLVVAQAQAALGTLLDSTTEDEVHTLPQVVARMKQPVYFISGVEDDIMEPKYVNHLASFHASFQCAGENVTQISNCGHMAMIEQTEQVETHIRQYLKQHGVVTTSVND
ncbi:MAG: alpha/beta hydrolase [Elainellaceae cyanobacterium]